MAIIYSYPTAIPTLTDLLLGTDVDKSGKPTKNFTIQSVVELIQGSAADMTKKAMLDLYKEGIIPHIQIHDELDLSIENDKQAKRVVKIMENAVTLEVPNKVDYDSGKNWGSIND